MGNAVTIGMKNIVAAKSNGDGTYTDGKVIGQAMTASLKPEFVEASLCADDMIVDNISEFTKGSISLGITKLENEDYAYVLGHKYSTEKGIVFNTGDTPAELGWGWYSKARDTTVKPAVEVYVAVWLCRVLFKSPSEDFATKGDKYEHKAQTLEGTYLADENGDYKIQQIFETEADAVAWLHGQAGIADAPKEGL